MLLLNDKKITFPGKITFIDYITFTGKVIRIGFRYDKSYGNIEIVVPEPETQIFFNQLSNGETVIVSMVKIPAE